MKVVFRVDASSDIGTGHVMRCISLAHGVERDGGKAIFVCRELPGHLCDEITANGITVLRLPYDSEFSEQIGCDDPPHGSWLRSSWQTDVAQTRAFLELMAPVDWLVVDHYGLDARWESALRPFAKYLMAIDDLFDRSHDVDVLLNQNILLGESTSYAGLLPRACRLLQGPRYALLGNHYRELRNRISPRSGKIEQILVYFGGVDEDNLTQRSLEALVSAGCNNLAIDVVLPIAGPHAESIRAFVARLPGAKVHDALPSLARLMANADLAIGAGGTTSWERLCLGLPTLIVTLSDNQIPIAAGLQANDLALWLGHHDEVTVERMVEALCPLIKEGLAPDWSARCRETVDGFGVERVVALLNLNPNSQLTARLATLDDEAVVGDWFTPAAGESKATYARMLRSLGDDRLYVVETTHGVIVGTILCTQTNDAWTLHTQLSSVVGVACPTEKLEQVVLRQLRADIEGMLLLTPELPAIVESMSISLCSDEGSWINNYIADWALQLRATGHTVSWAHDAALLPASQICFYLSYGRIVGKTLRSRHVNNLVVHESDLPLGRGWSPVTWQVLNGAQHIVVTLFEAVDAVDAGPIYGQTMIKLRGDELVEDLRRHQAIATVRLCSEFVDKYPSVLDQVREQQGTPSYFRQRTPSDSQVELDLPLRDQFNLLRVCDNNKYPAWFEHAGGRYIISIKRDKRDNYQN